MAKRSTTARRGRFDAFWELKEEVQYREGVCANFANVAKLFALLDTLPRHDSQIPPDMVKLVASLSLDPYPRAFWAATRSLERALMAVQEAASEVDGVFHGELKAKLEDRLLRFQSEGEELKLAFIAAESSRPDPSKPFAIRQQSLAGLVTKVRFVQDNTAKVRRRTSAVEIGDEAFARLSDAVTRLHRLRADLARCRDNPSQKMGRRATEWQQEYACICALIESVKCKISYEYLRAGNHFGGRCNEITASWRDEYETVDPWTFDPTGMCKLLRGAR